MEIKTSSKFWNWYLLRFFISLTLWEIIAFPLRLVLFAKFFNDSPSSILIHPTDLNLLGTVFTDLFALGLISILIIYSKPSLPNGAFGGLIFSLVLSLTLIVCLPLPLYIYTKINPSLLLRWSVFIMTQIFITTLIYSIDEIHGGE